MPNIDYLISSICYSKEKMKQQKVSIKNRKYLQILLQNGGFKSSVSQSTFIYRANYDK